VPNIYISHDVILSFYNQKTNIADYPEWEHLLLSFKCRDFFGIPNNHTLLENLEVPAAGFELLLDVIELVGYNDLTIKLLNKNLPDTYDLSKFPLELRNAMSKIPMSYNIITSCYSGHIKIWNAETYNLIHTLDTNTMVFDLCVSSVKKQIAVACYDNIVKIYNTETFQLIHTLIGHTDEVLCVYYSPDNERIVSGSVDNSINIWNTNTGQLVHTLIGHGASVYAVCYSPDGKQIASGSVDENIIIWDAITYQLVHILNHNNDINSICYSPNSKEIASGSDDPSIKIWNAKTGKLIRTLNAHHKHVQNVCYSSDNKHIVSGGDDNCIKIWNVKTGQLLRTFVSDGGILCVCYSPDNKQILSSGRNGSVKIWNSFHPDTCFAQQKSARMKDGEPGQLEHTLNGHSENVWGACYLLCFNDKLIEKLNKIIIN
jgi:WD40 repeat protein